MDLQPIFNVAEICHQAGITHAVLSPGSRCAPLVLAFTRHPEIECLTISDERSAAFIALGLAQAQGRPVVLICTSGSAAYNYAPAVSEAYFRNIPLLLLTADRPPEWIGQQDGQTIWQEGLYGKHVRYSRSALPDLTHPDARWHLRRIVTEALHCAISPDGGPVHVNIPFREPFYPAENEEFYYESEKQYIKSSGSTPTLSETDLTELSEEWQGAGRIMILLGQMIPDEELIRTLSALAEQRHILIAGDIISNVHMIKGSVQLADVFLSRESSDASSFTPDLLITFGGAFLSKNIKTFFRSNHPRVHWHIQYGSDLTDPLQSVSRIIRAQPSKALEFMLHLPPRENFDLQKQQNFQQTWRHASDAAAGKSEDFFNRDDVFGEFQAVYETIRNLPQECNLHLANSMAVRYANYCGIPSANPGVTVFSNRGACGIDGCTSTAAGTSLADPSRLNVLITGDMAFFYDRNAFWHNYPLPNLRIVLLNNHGGGIFRMIKGPSTLPELEPYFETRQVLTARLTCEEFGFEYSLCDKRPKLSHFLKELMMNDKRTKVMEIESGSERNTQILGEFKRWLG